MAYRRSRGAGESETVEKAKSMQIVNVISKIIG
jgi:hypothetical protein